MKVFISVILFVLSFLTYGQQEEGRYHWNGELFIELSDGEFSIWDETAPLFTYKAEYHINKSGILILDEMISGKDMLKFQSAWNSAQIEIDEDGIYFFEDFDRNDELMFFTRLKK